jgi:hypothetical protein
VKATFRPLRWTEPSTPPENRRSRYQFKAGWQNTLTLLERELGYLDATDFVIEADFTESDIRLDGMPRSGARTPNHPGVRVAFESKFGPLVYSTDSCEFWQHNVRSIALGLEALRAVDRYGVTKRGEQYTGWKAIGAGTIAMSGTISKVDAVAFLAKYGDPDGLIPDLATALLNGHFIDACYKRAARVVHPDHGGTAADFQRLQDAKRVLDGGTP